MKVTVELQRVGSSRVSQRGIPIQARVIQGGRRGENLLKSGMTDVESVKPAVHFLLEQRFKSDVEIDWLDRTEEK